MAVDAFLEILDSGGTAIEGESKDSAHEKLLQIRNFEFGVSMKADPTVGSGLGGGKAEFKEFTFDVDNSKASPVLFRYCCNGEHCQKAVLYVRKPGGKQQDYYIWTFKELSITNFGISCSENIVEKISFLYTALACEYRVQDQKGQIAKSGLKAGWDVKLNSEYTA